MIILQLYIKASSPFTHVRWLTLIILIAWLSINNSSSFQEILGTTTPANQRHRSSTFPPYMHDDHQMAFDSSA